MKVAPLHSLKAGNNYFMIFNSATSISIEIVYCLSDQF